MKEVVEMTAEEIFAGESDNVEFKSEIPAKSEKYMKTVVAFANGKGGKLIFGVENGTWAVTGFSKEEVFQKMDAITNAIFVIGGIGSIYIPCPHGLRLMLGGNRRYDRGSLQAFLYSCQQVDRKSVV